jgi:radical SAM/Cys-rich protein
MVPLTLLRRGSPLADTAFQQWMLSGGTGRQFESDLRAHSCVPLVARGITVLQVNVGKLCNQTCNHCHVDAGPDRREIMERDTMQACLNVLAGTDIPILDITGGAPEMNPNFRWFVAQARELDRHVIDRCNLTILLAPHFDSLPQFLADHKVEIVASLPCYLPENTDKQRGEGVFTKSIEALRRLNAVGYGRESALPLTLVYNPVGPTLPPPQAKLEEAYRQELRHRYGIVFTRLITITNMPISRFLDDLIKSEKYEQYMRLLAEAFNPAAVEGLMCRTTLSVGWDGGLYDCDFNQMLDLACAPEQPQTIWEFDLHRLGERSIVTGKHCYGCTAGGGSGCQGVIVKEGCES